MSLRHDDLDMDGRCRALEVEEIINSDPEGVAWHVAVLEEEMRAADRRLLACAAGPWHPASETPKHDMKVLCDCGAELAITQYMVVFGWPEELSDMQRWAEIRDL